MFSNNDITLVTKIVSLCSRHAIGLTTIESCTGGLISALLTSVSGSSSIIHSNIVTYANAAKIHYAHVDKEMLKIHGAVSTEIAQAMAEGGLAELIKFKAHTHQLALSVTGIAGPGGGTDAKPVGTVCFGMAASWLDNPTSEQCHFDGDRQEIRLQATHHSLLGAERILRDFT